MKRIMLASMAVAFLIAGPAFANCGSCGAGNAAAEEKGHVHHEEAMACPVDGAKVENMNFHASYEGSEYYFHADACRAAFEKNPAEFATAVCPVMGHPIKIKDAAAKSEFDGKTWYFCSVDMKKQFDANPEKYATFTCPVSGEILTYAETGATTEYKGETVRFCCGGCVAPFKENPEKFMTEAEAEPKHEEHVHKK
ncbi:MAG: YHS domain-containing protein [Candidatus Eisenbacteria bacterium]